MELFLNIVVRHRINDKKAHDSIEGQLFCVPDELRAGGDDPIRPGIFFYKVNGNLFGIQPADQIKVYKRDLSCGFYSIYNVCNVADVAI